MMILMFVTLFLLSSSNVDCERRAHGCRLTSNVSVDYCIDKETRTPVVKKEVMEYLPPSSQCFVSFETTTKHLICLKSGSLRDFAVKRRAKRQAFTAIGAETGALFGPIGAAVGAGVGLIADITCMFLCKSKDAPPPNTPPTLVCPTLSATTYTAEEGKTSATVSWKKATAKDKEDGSVKVEVWPTNTETGGTFSEGYHMVNFRAVDSKGLSATCSLLFEVKVTRCLPPRWPENGYLEITNLIFGSKYTVACKDGYLLDEHDKAPVKCTESGQWSRNVPDCKPKQCDILPPIENGQMTCMQGTPVYGSICQVVCEEGYRIRGMSFNSCDKNGKWRTVARCRDVTPPRFNSCPLDIQLNIDSDDNTAFVVWDLPNGKDNSGQTPTIKEAHSRTPNSRFKAGSHTIKYSITDSVGNVGDSCIFSIQISTISCQPPDLKVAGGEHLLYDCPHLNRFGSECTLSCRSGYPLGGVNKIKCLNDAGSDPPALHWRWDENGLAPFCKETVCPDLKGPQNGALACSLWDHGNMCQLQCQKGFDVPRSKDGLYVCGKSDGRWRPDDNVPDCNPTVHASLMHLPSDVYYYTGKCNSSEANLLQIRENFVKALNTSKFHENCVGVPECKAEFVNITCGPTSARRKRSPRGVFKREATSLAYTITFELAIPFTKDSRSVDDIFAERENVFYDMIDTVQKEMDIGHFDLPMPEIHLDSNSFGPGNVEFKCGKGMVPNRDAATCSGCPTGRYYDDATDDCQYCPVGTYQDEANSLVCRKCPPNTNTTGDGATNQSQCLELCQPGQSSPNGLSPCANCPTTSFQPEIGRTSCVPCGPGLRTVNDGSTNNSSCQGFDIKTTKGRQVTIVNHESHRLISVTFWMQPQGDMRNTFFSMKSSDGTMQVGFYAAENITINLNGKHVDTGYAVSKEWCHVGLFVKTDEFQLYLNGDKIIGDTTIRLSRTDVLEDGDVFEIDADSLISSFNIFGSSASEAMFKKWAQSCTVNETDYLYGMEDLLKSGNASITIPSVCDAVNECESSPCGNHVKECVNKRNGYTCICKDGYTGKVCDVKPNYCDNHECKNGGRCIDGTKNYTCDCVHGFHGELCEKKAVDGKWSDWSTWTDCSATCNGGLSERHRRCDSPRPHPDGKKCSGSEIENRICNTEKCPECTTLRRAYGLVISCNETDEMKRCTISCRPGLYFAKPPLPYYECGRITNYTWNHQNDKNPHGRLPSCSNIKPPTSLAVSVEGHYDGIVCTESNLEAAITSLESKLPSLECVLSGQCSAEVEGKYCGSRRRRADVQSIRVTIKLSSEVNVNSSDLHIQELLANKTAPSSILTDLVKQILEMEKTTQNIFNNSKDFFQVTIGGAMHTISGTSGLTVTPVVRCPSGSIRVDAFCADCPVGSYSDGVDVHLCPKGQFQDSPGQSSCKMCPAGKTTAGVGTVYMSECIDHQTWIADIADSKNENDGKGENSYTTVVIAVVVSLAVTILCVISMVVLYKHFKKRMKLRKVNAGPGTLTDETPPPYSINPETSMPAKTVFKTPLE